MEVDSFDGHHYISSVVPGGPVDTLNLLQLEDELLEVKPCRGRKIHRRMLSPRKLCSLIDSFTNASHLYQEIPTAYCVIPHFCFCFLFTFF